MNIDFFGIKAQIWKGGFWVRVFGHGICVSNGPLLWSERNGAWKMFQVFGLKVKWLSDRP